MEGMLTGFSLTPDGKAQNITVTVRSDFRQSFDELKDAPVEVEIKKARKHRSLDANAYCWKLIDLIAAKTGERKSDIYRAAIRDIGGVSDQVMCKVPALETFIRSWEKQGMGNQAIVLDVEEETGWAMVTIYYGSSTYDSGQMSALIDSLIQEAEQQGIPTITPEEEEKMLGRWTKKKEGKP